MPSWCHHQLSYKTDILSLFRMSRSTSSQYTHTVAAPKIDANPFCGDSEASSGKCEQEVYSTVDEVSDDHSKQQSTRCLPLRERLARNALSWICLVLTILLFILTITYASRPTFLVKLRVIRVSSSRTILVLRALSQIVDALLGICLVMALEKMQWYYIAQDKPHDKSGETFALISAIAPSTGVVGILQTLCRTTVKLGAAKLWSLVRLCLLALLFALGLLIMSMNMCLSKTEE